MKKIKLLFAVLGTSAILSMTSFAGEWKQDASGRWYQNDNGSYPVSAWQWIDDNNDGTAECYYFNEMGYLLTDTTTPDNCCVNSDGAWIVDGIVQTQNTSAPTAQESAATTDSTVPQSNTVWLSRTGSKYHRDPGCGNMKAPIESTLDEAISKGKTPCSKCN